MSDPHDEILQDYRRAVDEHSIAAITDRRGRIVHVNDEFCRLSQYSREELIGGDHRIINSGFHPSEFFADMWKTISAGQTWRGDIRNRAKDGTCYWVKTTIVPCRDESGQIARFVALRTDITEKVAMREKLERVNKRLSQLTEQLGQEKIALNNKNIALNELISHIEREKQQIKKIMATNLETVVFPLLESMRFAGGGDPHFIDLLEQSLKEISAPFFRDAQKLSSRLTPKELQICNMIKNGLTVKEIAQMLHLSPRTVDKHRENIREKLGIRAQKINLSSFLLNHCAEQDALDQPSVSWTRN